MATTPAPGPKPFNIAIVGGGISGLVLAISLLKHQVPITVYEAAPRFGEIGAGVGFHSNAARAMELISPAVRQAFERCATGNLWSAKKRVWFTVRVGDHRKAGPDNVVRGKEREGLRVGDEIFEVPFSAHGPKGGVHRAHFLDEMVKLVPGEVCRFGKKLVDIGAADDGSGDAVLHFADGTSARHSAVIGCDGIKSRTRELLLGETEGKAIFSGKTAYRGLIPMDKAVELLGEEQASNSQMWVGYHGHVLTFPIQKGKTLNVVAFKSCDSWTDPNWVVPTTKEALLDAYSGWGPTVSAVLSAMEKTDIWALFNHPPARTYYSLEPRICLLGDAAHASTPHQGSGAAMCIEDCWIMSELVSQTQSVQDLDKVFKVYDEVRRPRTQRLVETSREAGTLYEFELLGDDLDAIEHNFVNRMDWVWIIDLVAEAEKAKSMFEDIV